MTSATDIRESLSRFLESEIQVEQTGDRIGVLTPAEYPDGEGVVVWVTDRGDGRLEVSDLGAADARLAPLGPGARAMAPIAAGICRRLDVSFEGGVVVTRVAFDRVAEACWRVAQAVTAIAEAQTYHRRQQPKEATFVAAVSAELRRRRLRVQTEVELQGASQHPYVASVYLPATETVIEPISGEQAWNKAAAVYVEFGDLKNANGYTTVAVLDDLNNEVDERVPNLLAQVSDVTRWSDRDEWLNVIAHRQRFS